MQMASPRPPAPPVTTATCPLRSRCMGSPVAVAAGREPRVTGSVHVPRHRPDGQWLLLYFAAPVTRHSRQAPSAAWHALAGHGRCLIWAAGCSPERSKGGGRRPGDMSAGEHPAAQIRHSTSQVHHWLRFRLLASGLLQPTNTDVRLLLVPAHVLVAAQARAVFAH